MTIDLEYEITEMDKDILYLEQGEQALMSHFENIHPNFKANVDAALQKLSSIQFGS